MDQIISELKKMIEHYWADAAVYYRQGTPQGMQMGNIKQELAMHTTRILDVFASLRDIIEKKETN
jgi:hypothetical protein